MKPRPTHPFAFGIGACEFRNLRRFRWVPAPSHPPSYPASGESLTSARVRFNLQDVVAAVYEGALLLALPECDMCSDEGTVVSANDSKDCRPAAESGKEQVQQSTRALNFSRCGSEERRVVGCGAERYLCTAPLSVFWYSSQVATLHPSSYVLSMRMAVGRILRITSKHSGDHYAYHLWTMP